MKKEFKQILAVLLEAVLVPLEFVATVIWVLWIPSGFFALFFDLPLGLILIILGILSLLFCLKMMEIQEDDNE